MPIAGRFGGQVDHAVLPVLAHTYAIPHTCDSTHMRFHTLRSPLVLSLALQPPWIRQCHDPSHRKNGLAQKCPSYQLLVSKHLSAEDLYSCLVDGLVTRRIKQGCAHVGNGPSF